MDHFIQQSYSLNTAQNDPHKNPVVPQATTTPPANAHAHIGATPPLSLGSSTSLIHSIFLPPYLLHTNKTTVEYGTSFASPIVTGKIGKMMALSSEISQHMAKTLLIRTAEDSDKYSIEEIGFGFCVNDVTDILNCKDNKVVILYEGNIASKQNIQLPILLPNINGLKCNANITWTLSTLSELNPNDVDSYTCHCVEDYFYPHDKHYHYFKNTIHGRRQKRLLWEQIQKKNYML